MMRITTLIGVVLVAVQLLPSCGQSEPQPKAFPEDASVSDTPTAREPASWELVNGTPLHEAALNRSPAEVAELLNQGADIHARASVQMEGTAYEFSSMTPLHLAALNNTDPSVASALLDRGADIGSGTAAGASPLHVAASSASEE